MTTAADFITPKVLLNGKAFRLLSVEVETRVHITEFANTYLILLFQGPVNRLSSFVEGKRVADQLSRSVDISVRAIYGGREDIWALVIARRIMEVAGKDVLLSATLLPQVLNEASAMAISQLVMDIIEQSKTIS